MMQNTLHRACQKYLINVYNYHINSMLAMTTESGFCRFGAGCVCFGRMFIYSLAQILPHKHLMNEWTDE